MKTKLLYGQECSPMTPEEVLEDVKTFPDAKFIFWDDDDFGDCEMNGLASVIIESQSWVKPQYRTKVSGNYYNYICAPWDKQVVHNPLNIPPADIPDGWRFLLICELDEYDAYYLPGDTLQVYDHRLWTSDTQVNSKPAANRTTYITNLTTKEFRDKKSLKVPDRYEPYVLSDPVIARRLLGASIVQVSSGRLMIIQMVTKDQVVLPCDCKISSSTLMQYYTFLNGETIGKKVE